MFLSLFQWIKNNRYGVRKNIVKVGFSLRVVMFVKDYVVMLTIVTVSIVYLFDGSYSFLMKVKFPSSISYMGIFLALTSVVLKAWSYGTINKNWSATMAIYRQHELVTWGPYAHVRHPIYTSYVLMTIGAFFLSGILAFLLLGTLYILINLIRVKKEEKELGRIFDRTHKVYKRRVGMFIPKSVQVTCIVVLLLCNVVGMIDEFLFLLTGNSFTLQWFAYLLT
ncbi:MAG: isoprenylcysteine carboxylmethyltransferase family protein [Patescibacteria group bacterium]|nr:isoprenylcysteine carboxylmethyltransferase family protein [Patescibacteria group bacterium]